MATLLCCSIKPLGDPDKVQIQTTVARSRCPCWLCPDEDVARVLLWWLNGSKQASRALRFDFCSEEGPSARGKTDGTDGSIAWARDEDQKGNSWHLQKGCRTQVDECHRPYELFQLGKHPPTRSLARSNGLRVSSEVCNPCTMMMMPSVIVVSTSRSMRFLPPCTTATYYCGTFCSVATDYRHQNIRSLCHCPIHLYSVQWHIQLFVSAMEQKSLFLPDTFIIIHHSTIRPSDVFCLQSWKSYVLPSTECSDLELR